jgi:ArsR family transcriptional regulator
MPKHTPHPNRIAALRAVADPVRLAVIDELAREDACACELRARLNLSAPLLSHHLKVLREAGLVRTRKAGRRLEVELDRDALARVAGSLLPGEQAA